MPSDERRHERVAGHLGLGMLGLLLSVCVSVSVGAQARPVAESRPSPSRPSAFWARVGDPDRDRTDRLVAQAVQHLVWSVELALVPGSDRIRHAQVQSAVTRLRLARSLRPADASILQWFALALDELSTLAGGDRARHLEAMAAYQALRELAPDVDPERVAFSLGVLHTRLGHLHEAVSEYQRARSAAFFETPTVVANLAEVTMLSGDLDGAVGSYEDAVALGGGPLAHFGLAVALDRLGDHARALEHAREGVSGSSGMAVLRERGVFFEPAHELLYYEGLGYEALATLTPEDPNGLLRRAVSAYREFVRDAGDGSPFADRARSHIERLEAVLSSARARPRVRTP